MKVFLIAKNLPKYFIFLRNLEAAFPYLLEYMSLACYEKRSFWYFHFLKNIASYVKRSLM